MLPIIHSKGGQYYHRIKGLFGSSLIGYYPLWEPSGAVATDMSGNGRNGVYSGGTLANTTNPKGARAPTFTAPEGGVTLAGSASFLGAFNGDEGTFAITLKLKDLAQWTHVTPDCILYVYVDATNSIYISRPSAASYVGITRTADGTGKFVYNQMRPTGWFNILGTWSKSAGIMKIYNNGIKQPDTGASFIAIATDFLGTPTISRICAINSVPSTFSVQGWACDALFLNRMITDAEALTLSKILLPNHKTISIIGDSISASYSGIYYLTLVANDYGTGEYRVINHAAAGARALNEFDAQVVAAAKDDADMIIIELGTNDDNAGNMATLQAEIEENIAELKASNPRATIYYLNVLPRWTDVGGLTEVAKGNIRTAIAAACTAQGITCWDPYTVPWITSGDTSDGLHPTNGAWTGTGQVKIATEILALLP